MHNLSKEDRKITSHIHRPGIKPMPKPTPSEQDKADAQRFEAVIQAQLRDLFAMV